MLIGNARTVLGWSCGALLTGEVQSLSWNRTGANGKVSNVYVGGATSGAGTIFTCP